MQGDSFNRCRKNTVICLAISPNLNLGNPPGNVILPAHITGLPKDSVANVSLVFTLDRIFLTERVVALTPDLIQEVLDGIRLVLGM